MEARIVQSEKIILGNGVTVNVNPQADWGREATRERVISAVSLFCFVLAIHYMSGILAESDTLLFQLVIFIIFIANFHFFLFRLI